MTNVRDVPFRHGFDLVTGHAVFPRQSKKGSHLVEREAKLAGPSDE
jgi:hypothetical protein